MMSAISVMWREAYDRAHQENQQRRDRVLKHEDLAARLCQPPLSFSRPGVWNGFIPPRFLPPDEKGRALPNDSPRRAALIEIAAEAMRREGGQHE